MPHPPPMTAPELGRVAGELTRLLPGARIEEVRSRAVGDLFLRLRRPGETLWLLLGAHPRTPRAYLLPAPPPGAGAAGPFRERLRRELRGGRILAVEAPPGERILRLAVTAPGGPRRLVAELFGGRPNLVLLDGEERILAVLRPGGVRRPLRPGAPYPPPPPLPAAPRPVPPPRFEPGAGPYPWNAGAAAAFEAPVRQADLEEARTRLRRRLERERERLAGRLAALTAAAPLPAEVERLREMGEALKLHLHEVRRGMRELLVPNPCRPDSPPLRIPLDPALPPTANLERLFRRYRKGRAGERHRAARAAALREELVQVEARLARVAAAPDEAALRALADEAAPPRPTAPPRRLPYLAFRSADDLPIWVGRTARENDHLTFRLARGNDLWLHVRDHPGSHVVVRLGARRPCPPETLLDAAHLAVHFSPLRGAARAAVVYTPRKYVRRLPHARPGRVQLAQARTLEVRREPARLGRLLGRPV